MDEKFVENVWNWANQFVGKTITAPNDFDVRRLATASKEKAKEYEWLYHCTNMDGLLGILKSKEFWLTNLKNVNDSEEAERIDVPSYEKSYYVCCFTYEPDIPVSHWEEYGTIENGVIIGVRPEWFSRTPIFMTTAYQKCYDEPMKIFNNSKEALDYKIEKELSGFRGIDPYHVFDFDFYKIIYDDDLKKSILGDCTINLGEMTIPGKSISQDIPGIIKSRAGWCKRWNKEKYWKDWECEKEVRLKVGVHRLSHNEIGNNLSNTDEPYFRQLVIPLNDDAFDEIKIAFSPNFKDTKALLDEIKLLYPNSTIELL